MDNRVRKKIGAVPRFVNCIVTATQSIQLYQILQEHFGAPEHAAKAVSAIEEMIDEKVQAGSARHEEIVHKDIQLLRADVDNGLSELDKKLEMLRGSLETKIAEASTTNLRWVFSFFIALALMIIGLYLKK